MRPRPLTLLALLALAGPALAQAPGERPLEDLLQIVELEHALQALDARGGSGPRLALRVGERVSEKHTRGQVAVVLTDRRILAVAAGSAAWQETDWHRDEGLRTAPLLGDRVALVLTSRRVLGFDGGSGNLVEQRLGPQERLVGWAVGPNVAVAATQRRALGLSPFGGGFFEAPLQAGDPLESLEAASNLATLRTRRRLLTFRAPTSHWSERPIGLGH